MPRRRRPSSFLFPFSRDVDTAEAVESGNPRRIARRARNIGVGRSLAKAGFWSALWGSRR
jgi:hypothetical protein